MGPLFRVVVIAGLLQAGIAHAGIKTLDSPTGCGLTGLTTDGHVLYGLTVRPDASAVLGSYDPATGSGSMLLYLAASNIGFPSAPVYAHGMLYGSAGGTVSNPVGTIYSLDPATDAYRTIATLPSGPAAAIIVHGDEIYGVSYGAGAYDRGYVFNVDLASGHVHVLHSFMGGTDGAGPTAPLYYRKGVLYGTTGSRPQTESTLFRINVEGGDYRILHTFNPGGEEEVLSSQLGFFGGKLVGTKYDNFPIDPEKPTIFAADPDTGNVTVLHRFSGSGYLAPSDLIRSGSTFYGVAGRAPPPKTGTNNSGGGVFEFQPDTGTFTGLHSFNYPDDANGYGLGGVIVAGGVLYGSTIAGGPKGCGVLFSLTL